MIPAARQRRFRRGISLVETMVAAAVLLIAVVGTCSFRYSAALEGRKAKAQMAAARIALALCESWRGNYGDAGYNPLLLDSDEFAISDAGDSLGPSTPSGFTELGTYAVTLSDVETSNVNFYATLSYTDVETGLRALNVVVGWVQRDTGDIEYSSGNLDKSFTLTTYSETL